MADDQDARPPEYGDLVSPDRPIFGRGSAFGFDLKQVNRHGRGKWYALVLAAMLGAVIWALYGWL